MSKELSEEERQAVTLRFPWFVEMYDRERARAERWKHSYEINVDALRADLAGAEERLVDAVRSLDENRRKRVAAEEKVSDLINWICGSTDYPFGMVAPNFPTSCRESVIDWWLGYEEITDAEKDDYRRCVTLEAGWEAQQ